MARNTKQTSKHAASAASRVLRDKRTSKDSKTAAGSALAQRASRKKWHLIILVRTEKPLSFCLPLLRSLRKMTYYYI